MGIGFNFPLRDGDDDDVPDQKSVTLEEAAIIRRMQEMHGETVRETAGRLAWLFWQGSVLASTLQVAAMQSLMDEVGQRFSTLDSLRVAAIASLATEIAEKD